MEGDGRLAVYRPLLSVRPVLMGLMLRERKGRWKRSGGVLYLRTEEMADSGGIPYRSRGAEE